MKQFIAWAKTYVKEMKLSDVAVLKICLAAFGLMIGLHVPKAKKRPVMLCALAVFCAACVPLVGKFIAIASRQVKSKREIEPVQPADAM